MAPGAQRARRCGKLTLLQQLMASYQREREHPLHVNFEEPRLAGVLEPATRESRAKTFEARIGRAVPVQVTGDTPAERRERGLDEFLAAHRNAGEPVVVAAKTFERGLKELNTPECAGIRPGRPSAAGAAKLRRARSALRTRR